MSQLVLRIDLGFLAVVWQPPSPDCSCPDTWSRSYRIIKLLPLLCMLMGPICSGALQSCSILSPHTLPTSFKKGTSVSSVIYQTHTHTHTAPVTISHPPWKMQSGNPNQASVTPKQMTGLIIRSLHNTSSLTSFSQLHSETLRWWALHCGYFNYNSLLRTQ